MSARRNTTGLGALLLAQATAIPGFLLTACGDQKWVLATGLACMGTAFASAVVAAARAW